MLAPQSTTFVTRKLSLAHYSYLFELLPAGRPNRPPLCVLFRLPRRYLLSATLHSTCSDQLLRPPTFSTLSATAISLIAASILQSVPQTLNHDLNSSATIYLHVTYPISPYLDTTRILPVVSPSLIDRSSTVQLTEPSYPNPAARPITSHVHDLNQRVILTITPNLFQQFLSPLSSHHGGLSDRASARTEPGVGH